MTHLLTHSLTSSLTHSLIYPLTHELQADPETQLNFHSYLLQRPLDGFRPENYPISALMQLKRTEAMCVKAWFEAWSSGEWTRPGNDDDDSGDFTPGQFYPSTSLFMIFSQWAVDHAPASASLTEKQVFDKLAAFAANAADRLKGPMSFRFGIGGVPTKGYRMAIDNGQFSQFAA